jgi:hypothetical protein
MKSNTQPLETTKKGAFIFLWKVPRGGYYLDEDLISAPAPIELGDVPLNPPWLVGLPDDEMPSRQYAPFQKPNLFRQFSALSPHHKAIARFASRYGLLGHKVPLIYPNQPGQPLQEGESLQFWQREIQEMAILVELWDLVRYEREEPLSKIILWRNHPRSIIFKWQENRQSLIASDLLPDGVSCTQWEYKDVIGPARYYLCRQINERLRSHVSPSILPFLDGEIYMFPDSLLSAMYVMFALEVSGRIHPAIQCRGCGVYFVPTHKRQVYHDDACRKLTHYYRKRSVPNQQHNRISTK